VWTPEAQKAFKQMKALIAKDVLVRHPDHKEEFHVIADASNCQLGAVIMQNNAPVAFALANLTQLNATQLHHNGKTTSFLRRNSQRVPHHALWMQRSAHAHHPP
jgi:hypothetical protein